MSETKSKNTLYKSETQVINYYLLSPHIIEIEVNDLVTMSTQSFTVSKSQLEFLVNLS
jgi:hypothetical protein